MIYPGWRGLYFNAEIDLGMRRMCGLYTSILTLRLLWYLTMIFACITVLIALGVWIWWINSPLAVHGCRYMGTLWMMTWGAQGFYLVHG